MVAGKDQNVRGIILLDKGEILIDGVRRPLKPFRTAFRLIGGKDMYAAVSTVEIPRFSVSDIVVQHERLILGQNADRIDPRINAVRKRKIDDPVFPSERNGRLRNLVGKRIKPASLSSREQHCHAFFFLFHNILRAFLPKSRSIIY